MAAELDPTIHVLEVREWFWLKFPPGYPDLSFLQELREQLLGGTRDWRATRTQIQTLHPTADLSRLQETDPAQVGDLRLVPTEGDRSTIPASGTDEESAAEKFLWQRRGIIELGRSAEDLGIDDEMAKNLRPDDFKNRVIRLGDLMNSLAVNKRESTDLQPGEHEC